MTVHSCVLEDQLISFCWFFLTALLHQFLNATQDTFPV